MLRLGRAVRSTEATASYPKSAYIWQSPLLLAERCSKERTTSRAGPRLGEWPSPLQTTLLWACGGVLGPEHIRPVGTMIGIAGSVYDRASVLVGGPAVEHN